MFTLRFGHVNSMFGFIKFIFLKEPRLLKIRKQKYFNFLNKRSPLRFVAFFLIRHLKFTFSQINSVKHQLFVLKNTRRRLNKLNISKFLKLKKKLLKLFLKKKYLFKLLRRSLKLRFLLPKKYLQKNLQSRLKLKLFLFKNNDDEKILPLNFSFSLKKKVLKIQKKIIKKKMNKTRVKKRLSKISNQFLVNTTKSQKKLTKNRNKSTKQQTTKPYLKRTYNL